MSTRLARRARDALLLNRDNAVKIVQGKGLRATKRMLEDATDDLQQRLDQAEGLRGPGAESFTATKMRVTLRQIQQTTKAVVGAMKSTVLSNGHEAAEQSAEHTIDYMKVADKAFRGIGEQPLALTEAAVMDSAIQGARASVLRRLTQGRDIGLNEGPAAAKMGILKRYGVETIAEFETILQRGLLTGKSWDEMKDELIRESPFLQGKPAFWATRIVRTECMAAYGKAAWQSVNEMDEQLGDMVKILSATFDERTGADSYAVHGQIRRPSEPFEWWEGFYMHPPNRPNDREIIVPHRIAWDIPEYLLWRDDEEVEKAWKERGYKGPVPPRPRMTTVSFIQFGKEDAEESASD